MMRGKGARERGKNNEKETGKGLSRRAQGAAGGHIRAHMAILADPVGCVGGWIGVLVHVAV